MHSFVYSCHLFLIPSASVFTENVPLVSLISLKRSLVFPFLLFSSIYLHWSPRTVFFSLLAFLLNSAFRLVYLLFLFCLLLLFFSYLSVRPHQTTILPLFFFFLISGSYFANSLSSNTFLLYSEKFKKWYIQRFWLLSVVSGWVLNLVKCLYSPCELTIHGIGYWECLVSIIMFIVPLHFYLSSQNSLICYYSHGKDKALTYKKTLHIT